jgi:hypothetical protein
MYGTRLVLGGSARPDAVERRHAVGEATGTRPSAPPVGDGLDPGRGAGHHWLQPRHPDRSGKYGMTYAGRP